MFPRYAICHRCARFAAGLVIMAVLVSGTSAQQTAAEKRMRQDLAFLASADCEGRGVYTKGIEKAADYIAKQFRQAGLKPGGKNGSYFQPFPVSGRATLQQGSRVVLNGPKGQKIDLAAGQFQVMGYSTGGGVTAPVVFVGFGVTDPMLDEYKNIDVRGKVVIVLRRLPRWGQKDEPFRGDVKNRHAALVNKLANAESHRAAGMILVNDPSDNTDQLVPFRQLAQGVSSGSIPAVHVKRDVANRLLQKSINKSLTKIEGTIAAKLASQSTALKGWTVTMDARVRRKVALCKNVIGVLPGKGPLAKEIVVIGAHYDHLGYGESGTRARKPADRKKIHFGADDNGSGTTAVLELARRFGNLKNREGRTLVFMTFSAEEKGLFGSKHYCNKEPLFSLKKTVAMVNLDMVGRMQEDQNTGKGTLRVQGVGTAKSFDGLIEKINREYGFLLKKSKGGTGPSDHDSFYRKNIPVFFIWTGIHKDYHLPTDTHDRINYKDMLRITNLTEDVIGHLASTSKRPQFVLVKSANPVRPIGNIPKMGIRPGYEDNAKGLPIDGVSPGGAAEKGGMKAGDVIIEINKQRVTNINSYMVVISRQKRGQAIPVVVLRKGKKVTLKIAPR